MLKESCPKVGVGRLCGLFGKSRQAYYQINWHKEQDRASAALVLEMVLILRREMPRLGTRKLHYMLTPFLEKHKIKMGRDKLHKLLSDHGLSLQRKRKHIQTTYAQHWLRKYSNLIKELVITQAEQLWVSDITYIALTEGFCYLSLITDAYSRLIVGYCLYPTLESQGSVNALMMALAGREKSGDLIHHSDRGIQYCSTSYIKILKKHNIAISMTEKGSPYENALAERVNGILKGELGLGKIFDDLDHASAVVDQAIITYNSRRPHSSCDYLTPDQAHLKTGELKKRWKQYGDKKQNKTGSLNSSSGQEYSCPEEDPSL